MIENSLIQSNFIGRDGFRWWVGQVAPEDAQGGQINGDGWGDRVKVRILGYHPEDDVELKNEELPWAHVLKSPESGSGRAGRGKPPKISPGDTVLGFFLDGDNAQQPVILGVFSSSVPAAAKAKDKEYSQPFVPFTGYTSKVKPNDNIAQSEAGDQNKVSSPTNRQVDTETAKKIEEATGQVTKVASTVLGTTITFGDTGGARSGITKINGEVENALKNYKNAIPFEKSKILSDSSKTIANFATGMSAGMISSTFTDMAPKMNEGLHKLYKDKYGEVLAKTGGNIALAKKAAAAAQQAKVPAILNIENAIPCMMKNVTDKLQGNVSDLLAPLLDNVQNFNNCIGDQFSAGILNSVIGSIDESLAPLMGDVADIFPGDIAGMLRDKADGLFGLSDALGGCDLPTAASQLGQKTNQWTIGKGPKSLVVKSLGELSGSLLSIANAADSLKEAAGGAGVLTNLLSGVDLPLGAFDFLNPLVNSPGYSSELGDCYTGEPLNCSGIKVNVFGGDGTGASGQAIIGALVGDNLAEQTGSLIGVTMTNMGTGYTTPPFVEIIDTCNQGYGGLARAVIDYDKTSPTYSQVTDIYVVNGGESYPVIETNDETYTVDHVVVVNPGQGYNDEDVITDQQGNVYIKFLDSNGRLLNVIPPNPSNENVQEVKDFPELSISTNTGSGAILKAQITPRPEYQGEIKQVIDCITPRDGIVGFVNGEPYYGAFHVHPPTGLKMVGAVHTTAPHAIIYDTPQESRTSRGMVSATSTITTVSSPEVQENVSNTTTQIITSSTTTTNTVDYSNQQTTQQSNTSVSDNTPSDSGSSGSGGGYSGY